MVKKSSFYFYLLVSVTVFLYVSIRTFTVDITYDEATTVRDFVPLPYLHILNFTRCSTNNHILNTLLIKTLHAVFGESVFSNRLPNLLALLLFLFYGYKITTAFLSQRLAMITFLFLVLNPFLLDFFGLARGYGMSIALETASLYYLLVFFKKTYAPSHLVAAFTWAAFAVLANFSLINFYLAVAGLALLHVMTKKEGRIKNILYGFFVTLALTLIVWEPVRKLRANNGLDYGGSAGFYEDTLQSLATFTAYTHTLSTPVLYALQFFLLLFAATVIASFYYKVFWTEKNYSVLLLLVISCLSTILQHHLLGNPYLIDRTALFLYPPILFSLGFSLDGISRKWVTGVVAIPLLLLLVGNFLVNANLYRTVTWDFCARNKEILQKIDAEGRRVHKKQKIDFSWPLSVTLRYHHDHHHYEFIEMNTDWASEHKDPFDYYVYFGDRVQGNGYLPENEIIHQLHKDTFAVYRDLHLYIFRNFTPAEQVNR